MPAQAVKLAFRNETRRVHLDTALADSWSQLLKQALAAFALPADTKQLVVRYLDDEGELITVSSSEELAEAARVAAAARSNLKLFLALPGDATSPASAPSLSRAIGAEVSDSADATSEAASDFVDVEITSLSPEQEKELDADFQQHAAAAAASQPKPVSEPESKSEPVFVPEETATTTTASAAVEPAASAPEKSAVPESAPAQAPSADEEEKQTTERQVRAAAGNGSARVVEVDLDLDEILPALRDAWQDPQVRVAALSALPTVIASLRPGVTAAQLVAQLQDCNPVLASNASVQRVVKALQPLLPVADALLQHYASLAQAPWCQLLQQHVLGALRATPETFCAPSPSPSPSPSRAVHVHVRCDGCNELPITGTRFKCARCPDFDLCERCEAKGVHAKDHPLIKMRLPDGASEDLQGRAIHRDVACDGCNTEPIVGIRYKCTVCRNFDLCEKCEASGKHPAHHNLLMLKEPETRRAPFWRGHFVRPQPCSSAESAATAAAAASTAAAPRPGTTATPSPAPSSAAAAAPAASPQNNNSNSWAKHVAGPRRPVSASASSAPSSAADAAPSWRKSADADSVIAPASSPSAAAAVADALRAEFVQDLTVPDHSFCAPNAVLMKTWLMKNTGSQRWPEGTHLVYVSGDVVPEAGTAAKTMVPLAGPGETVSVSVAVRTPSQMGHFVGNFRLCSPRGCAFGHRVWVTVNVASPAPSVPAPAVAPAVAAATASAVPSAPKLAPAAIAVAAPKPSPIPVAAPAAVSGAEVIRNDEPHAEALRMLRGMGFNDTPLNRFLLLNNNGDILRVVEFLLSRKAN